MSTNQDLRDRRRERLRYQLRQKAYGRPRLSVFRSGKNIYAQVIDDAQGRTLAAASSLDRSVCTAPRGSVYVSRAMTARRIGCTNCASHCALNPAPPVIWRSGRTSTPGAAMSTMKPVRPRCLG